MARALTTLELAYLRSEEQHSRLFLTVLSPAVVMRARLNGDPSSDDKVASLTIDTVTWGSGYTAAKAHMLIYVGSQVEAYDKGMVRLREDLSGTPTSMKIGEISEVAWADNDYLTIVEEFPLAARHMTVDEDGVARMDYDIDYSDQHQYPDPVPVLGPSLTPTWLFGADVQVNFDASDSWVLDGGGLTYAWAFPGSSSNGGLTGATTWAKYDAVEEYRVECTVTRDYGGGNVKSTTGYRYVKVHSPASMPFTEFELGSCGGSWDQQGWSFRVTMYADATLTDIRDRALACLFARDWYGGTEVSIGPIANRENIVCVGRIVGETIVWDAEVGSVTFEVQGPHHWLNQMRGFPAGIEDVQETPDEWVEFEDLDVRSGLWEVLHWRSTTTRVIDVYLTDDTRGIFVFAGSPGTLLSQITDDAEVAIKARPCCDRFGRLFIDVEPQLVPSADRAGWPVVHTFQSQDVERPVSIRRQVMPRTGQVDLMGIYYSGGSATPFFSLSPGHIPKGVGAQISRPDRLALASQAQSNDLAGLFLGWENNEYPNIPLGLASNHRMLDIAPYQIAELALAAGDTVRGGSIDLDLLIRSVGVTYDRREGYLGTKVGAEAVTLSLGGIDGDAPPEPPGGGSVPSLPPPWSPLPDTSAGWPTKVYVATLGMGVYYTDDFTGTGGAMSTWAEVRAKQGGGSIMEVRQLKVDLSAPEDYQYLLTGYWRGGPWYDKEVYRRQPEVSSGEWVKILDNTIIRASYWASSGAICSIETDETGAIYVLAIREGRWSPATEVVHRILKSVNYGASWTVIDTLEDTSLYENYGDYILNINQGHMYFDREGKTSGGAADWDRRMLHSHDGGSSWQKTASLGTIYNPLPHALNYAAPSHAFFSESYGSLGLSRLFADNSTALKQAALMIYEASHCMWNSPNDATYMRLLDNYRLYSTEDEWNTLVDATPSLITQVGMAHAFAPFVSSDDVDQMIIGAWELTVSVPHVVGVLYGDIDTTFEGKAGEDCGASPFTDSIPYTCGGVSRNGIQVVDFS